MRFEWSCIALVAICWGGYPLIARAAGFGGPVGTLVLFVSGLLPVSLAALSQVSAARPSAGAVGKLGIAGVIMGVGMVAFNLVANSKLEASVSLPIVDTAMLLVSTVGAIYLFQEPLSTRKAVALCLLVAGIVIMPSSS